VPIQDDLDQYGPLAGLIGDWKGDRGLDVARENDGPDDNPYFESITFEPVGEVENAEEQVLMAVAYKQIVYRKSNDEAFHHQQGYFIWEKATNAITHAFTIPRGLSLLCNGNVESHDNKVQFEFWADSKDENFNIIQTPFMKKNAKTESFTQTIKLASNQLSYRQVTKLNIYGKDFDHSDESVLIKQN